MRRRIHVIWGGGYMLDHKIAAEWTKKYAT